ncbi:hypothetical protein H7827_12295 [Streptomyces sp. JH002]|uniref:HEAT repeat domain-containing protein n=1 Tax=Streptomyces sp. JH002 TaxID=2763259 RepID=UPI003D8024FF
MLERLDETGWGRLTHAYGYAGDVPGQLRSLSSAEPEERQAALSALYGNIFHQGTRYEASVPAVPFLLALATDPGTPERDGVLWLLAALAIGYDDPFVPEGFPVAELRRAARGGAELAATAHAFELADRPREGGDEGWEDDGPARYFYEASLSEADQNRLGAHVALAAYDAVRAGLPAVRELTAEHEPPEIRRAAAYLLAWFPEDAAQSVPVLIAAAAGKDGPTAAIALTGLGLLGAPYDAAVAGALESALSGDAPEVVRWGAATALARLRGPAAGERAIGELRAWLARDGGGYGGRHPDIPFLDGNVRGYAAQSLRALGDPATDAATFDGLLGQLPRLSGPPILPVLDAALALAFPDGAIRPGTPAGELTDRQRRLAGLLADNPGCWRTENRQFGNVGHLIACYGLPGRPDRLAGYLAREEAA